VDDGQNLKNDDFRHEQNLIIEENEKLILIAGCAHKGMINIIDEAMSIMGRHIDYAIGGLHMFSRSTGISESKQMIERMGKDFLTYHTHLFTCHCTGENAYEILKPIMGERIEYIRTGMTIKL
jgi:7,8-dihydropterin-6-yl-methyl-4-(beta-D-ribofuranosyl)aminobenzene 5'-phosphate synthase